jgi:hypothetical protein
MQGPPGNSDEKALAAVRHPQFIGRLAQEKLFSLLGRTFSGPVQEPRKSFSQRDNLLLRRAPAPFSG